MIRNAVQHSESVRDSLGFALIQLSSGCVYYIDQSKKVGGINGLSIEATL